MKSTKSQLQQQINQCPRTAAGRRRYPADLRRAIVTWLQSEVRSGAHFESLCEELDLNASLARRWRQDRRYNREGFKKVKVVDSRPEPPAPSEAPAKKAARDLVQSVTEATPQPHPPMTLTSPSGWRLEGLDLSSVMVLLPRLS